MLTHNSDSDSPSRCPKKGGPLAQELHMFGRYVRLGLSWPVFVFCFLFSYLVFLYYQFCILFSACQTEKVWVPPAFCIYRLKCSLSKKVVTEKLTYPQTIRQSCFLKPLNVEIRCIYSWTCLVCIQDCIEGLPKSDSQIQLIHFCN